MIGVFWGLLGAMLIGASDCIARVTTARVSASILISCIMGLSVVALFGWIMVTGDWPAWHFRGWLFSFLSGTLTVVALVFLYKALVRGPVSVASPAASIFVVLLVGLNVLAGEAWSWIQIVAIVIVFAGVVMLARRNNAADQGTQYDSHWLRITAAYGVATAFTVAVRMFLAQDAGDILGPIESLFLNRVFALLAGLVWVLWQVGKQYDFQWPSDKTRGLVALQAVFETSAFCAFLIGSATGGRVGTAIGFAAFAAATVVFARIWLGEVIGVYRGIWIGVIACGVVLAVLGAPSVA